MKFDPLRFSKPIGLELTSRRHCFIRKISGRPQAE
jgi:hypothetical protein